MLSCVRWREQADHVRQAAEGRFRKSRVRPLRYLSHDAMTLVEVRAGGCRCRLEQSHWNYHQRSAERIAVAFCCLLAAGAVAATEPAAVQPKGSFETAPVLAGALVAPAALLKGPPHSVAVSGAESVIVVASQVQGETRVRFLVESVRMLGQ